MKRPRVERMKLPAIFFHTKWKSSRSPHMFWPDPAMSYDCRLVSYEADPRCRVRPTSDCASKMPTVLWPLDRLAPEDKIIATTRVLRKTLKRIGMACP